MDLNGLPGTIFDADYEFHIDFLEKNRFSHRKSGFKFCKNRILNFLTKMFSPKILKDLPFDAEFHSLQNGRFGFDFGS